MAGAERIELSTHGFYIFWVSPPTILSTAIIPYNIKLRNSLCVHKIITEISIIFLLLPSPNNENFILCNVI